MISTINISLPAQLKSEAEKLIESGYFVSFSDLTRTAIRRLVESKYDFWADEAKKDFAKGKLTEITDEKDVGGYLKKISGE